MNISRMKIAERSMMNLLTRCREQTVTTDQKLEAIAMALADICTALATDGTQESIDAWYDMEIGG